MGFLNKTALAIAGAAAGYITGSAVADRAAAGRNRTIAKGKRIVVLGLGFGGSAVANELCALLPGDDNGHITVIDEDNYLLFTPMLTEAAGGEIDPRHIAVPANQLVSRVRFLYGEIQSIDLASKTVSVKLGSGDMQADVTRIEADHLVIALGSVTNFHHVPGAADNALTVKRLEDAQAVCDRALNCLQYSTNLNDRAERRALLTFVVAGGGYTGVEIMAALNDLVRERASGYGADIANEIQTILVNPSERLLAETSEELASYAMAKLRERRVDIRLNASVTDVSKSDVQLSTGERIPTRTFIWAAGVKPNPVVDTLGCEKGKHRGIKTDPACQVLQHPGIWAIGDCAEVPDPEGKTYAPTAQNATRQGVLVAHNIVRAIKSKPAKPFIYKPIGQLALVGKHAGVARIWGVNFSGMCAWAMWRAIYLAKIPSSSQRVRIVLDWTMDLLFGRTPVALGAKPDQAKQERHVAGAAS